MKTLLVVAIVALVGISAAKAGFSAHTTIDSSNSRIEAALNSAR